MDIFIYDNNNQDFIKLPVVPQSIEVQSSQKIDTFDTLGYGELKIIGLKGNKKLSIESFFPKKDYPFLRDRTYKGMEYVDKIQLWRETRVPLSIIITDLDVNFKFVIENFNYSVQDGSGDIYYTLDVEEYQIPETKKNIVSQSKIVTIKQGNNESQIKNNIEYLKNSYGIVTARSGLNVRTGNGTSYTKIGAIKYGEKVKLFKLENGWWNIYFRNKIGHVSSQYIRRI